MDLFDGKNHAKNLDHEIEGFIETPHTDLSIPVPKLKIIQVGDDPASSLYVGLKKKLCDRLGIPVEVMGLAPSLEDQDIASHVKKEFSREDVAGGIVQLPLPRPSLDPVLGLIPPEKDLDLLSPESRRRYYAGDFVRLSPTVRAFDYFVEYLGLELPRLSIGVVGYGELVGKPISHYATISGAEVRVVGHYQPGQSLDYDLVVLSAGIPNLVCPSDLPDECLVVDFGSGRVGDKTVGDLDSSKDLSHLGFVSPSPGGMGPLVVRFLIMNLLGI
jgi:methylenetetrahydrofolate dehydrogenase (NADP+) / methenyltetrahydrofolate cyclohydrolase